MQFVDQTKIESGVFFITLGMGFIEIWANLKHSWKKDQISCFNGVEFLQSFMIFHF